MYELEVQNEGGGVLTLTGNNSYVIKSVSGLLPPIATINTTTVTNFDGARFNSSKVGMRNIVITVLPNEPVDENRINLYKYFKPKKFVRLYYKNNVRDCFIDGCVESVDGDLHTNRQEIQISIVCPSPYFQALNETTVTVQTVLSEFELPFALEAPGVNIYTGTKDFSGDNWTNRAEWISDGLIDGFTVLKRQGAWFGLGQEKEFEAGKYYTFSGFVKSAIGGVMAYCNNGTADFERIDRNFGIVADWTRVEFTVECTVSGTTYFRFECDSEDGELWVYGLKLEEGQAATHWSPAPADDLYDPDGIVFSDLTGEYSVQLLNNGDVETGLGIRCIFSGNVVELTIRDIVKNQKMCIEWEFLDGDVLDISTIKGQKSLNLRRGSTDYNLINYLTDDSQWLTASEGENVYEYSTVYGNDNLEIYISHTDLFEGV